jgi:gamma-glutamyl-gamma-aminobutyraldehyde dehydrogenase
MDQSAIDRLRVEPVAEQALWIGGRGLPAAGGATLDVTSPIDGRRIAAIPDAGPEDVDRAIAAARAAFEKGS